MLNRVQREGACDSDSLSALYKNYNEKVRDGYTFYAETA